jgi:hypothetical protein
MVDGLIVGHLDFVITILPAARNLTPLYGVVGGAAKVGK